jgi:hypothetical protein
MKPVPGLLFVALTASVLVSLAHAESDNWYSPSAARPPGLCCVGFVHDDVHNQTVLFGGNDGYPNFAVHGETWTLEVGGWVQHFPTNSPSPRTGPGMAFDAANGNVVLFGGNDANGNDLSDTWTWDGQSWTQVFPPVSPPARSFETNGMVFSPAGNYVVMFGGLTQSPQQPGVYGVLGDTWTWDGTTWTQHQGAGPSPRRAPLARDGGGNVLLFGGDNVTGYFGDTWIWNAGANNGNGAWQQKNPPIAPPPRGLAATAWDPVRHGVILFGGSVLSTALSDTWLWKSGAWTQLTAPTVPPIRYAFGMAYDPRANGVVMYGGYGLLYASNDLWTLESDVVPGLNVTPTTLNFGDQRIGAGLALATETITVTNDGSTTLTGLTLGLALGFEVFYYSAGNFCLSDLAPGASCAVGIAFFPTSPGPVKGTMTLGYSNSPSVNISVAGTGVAGVPTLTSIAPNTGDQNTSETVTLTGVGLTGATALNISGGGITFSGLTVVNDTTITATFSISATAALTARNVTVTTPAGTTSPVTFTVATPGTPVLFSITPNSGLRSVAGAPNPTAVTLTGTGFTAASTVNVVAPANGLTVTGVTYVSPTTISATLNTTTTATIGPRTITVTTPGGTSGTVLFNVL